ncbi:MAG: helix-turn-helix domain-containing protein [Actinobacteria bacterium]|nr:helix-turn-helix domain-containing protein [Actinomycetota bacterium]MCG2808636.1 helix-turn-helix domain-containing protein [Coriobacteriia bacterium]
MGNVRDIGRDLVAARRAGGLTQRELGELVGVAQPQIARWEATRYRSASLDRVTRVAEALGYDLAEADAPLAAESTAQYGVALPGADTEAFNALRRTATSPGAIAAFARSHHVARLDLFGSILGDRFCANSDVDVLVTYESGRTPSLLDMSDHETELSALLRRRVDLVSRRAIERSGNIIRRDEILDSARTLYARP